MSFLPSNTVSPYLATSLNWQLDDNQLRNQLTNAYIDIAYSVNIREISAYDLVEVVNGQQFFFPGNPQRKRYAFRKVFSIGAIVSGATSTTPHGIVGVTAFTDIRGTCVTDAPDYRPIPYSSATDVTAQIEIKITSSDIVIINGAAAPNITSALVILEYLKN